jgi:SSS family solute:Na+ symporter
VWATSATLPDGSLIVPPGSPPNTELAQMVSKLTGPVLAGVLGAGILAAIMSSLDSQFLCLGTMFVHDIVVYRFGEDRFSDRQRVYMARGFILAIVAITYLLSLAEPVRVFTLGVWCFSGFASLFPLVCAAIYWKRVTAAGAFASVAVTAVTWLALFRAADFGGNPNYLVYGMLPVTPIFLCSVLALIGVSLITAAPSERTLRRYFPEKSAARVEVLAGAAVAAE